MPHARARQYTRLRQLKNSIPRGANCRNISVGKINSNVNSAMALHRFPVLSWLTIVYRPEPEKCNFLDRAQTQTGGQLEVQAAVLDVVESRIYFGVPMARRGIQ